MSEKGQIEFHYNVPGLVERSVLNEFNGRLYKSVSGYDRQVAPGVTVPERFAVNENSIGTT